MGVNCCRKDDLDKVMPFKETYDILTMVTIIDKLEHVKAIKR